MVLATEEKALLAFEPTRRMVPTTKTKITASITAYSAMSCPLSSLKIWGIIFIALQALNRENSDFRLVMLTRQKNERGCIRQQNSEPDSTKAIVLRHQHRVKRKRGLRNRLRERHPADFNIGGAGFWCCWYSRVID